MKSVALTIHFVYEAEIATLHRDLVDAFALITEHEKWPGYNPEKPPRLYVKNSVTHSWVISDIGTEPEF